MVYLINNKTLKTYLKIKNSNIEIKVKEHQTSITTFNMQGM